RGESGEEKSQGDGLHGSPAWGNRVGARALEHAADALAGLAAKGVPAGSLGVSEATTELSGTAGSASEGPAERRADPAEGTEGESAGEACGDRHDLAHDEEGEGGGHADADGLGDLDASSGRCGLVGGRGEEREHECGDEDGENGNESVVAELGDPGLEEAFGGLEEKE